MSTLATILIATAAGSLLSLLLAGILAFSARPNWVPVLVSYAIGALLGAALLEVLPEAVEMGGDIKTVAKALLGGILMFFLLEKLVLWRHCHDEICEAHGSHGDSHHDHGRSGMMITVGDTFHNFVDGIIIAGAFLVDYRLGVVTALAIIAHEIPQEIGDFLILLHSGYITYPGVAAQLPDRCRDIDWRIGRVLRTVHSGRLDASSIGSGRGKHVVRGLVGSDTGAAQARRNSRNLAATSVDRTGNW